MNILVKVDKFIYVPDFIILDVRGDKVIPLTSDRKFLAIGRALVVI